MFFLQGQFPEQAAWVKAFPGTLKAVVWCPHLSEHILLLWHGRLRVSMASFEATEPPSLRLAVPQVSHRETAAANYTEKKGSLFHSHMHGWRGEGWVRPCLWAAHWPVPFMVCTNDFYFCFLMQCISQSREQLCHATANVLTAGCRLTGLSQAGVQQWGTGIPMEEYQPGGVPGNALAWLLPSAGWWPFLKRGTCPSPSRKQMEVLSREIPPHVQMAQQGHRQIAGSFLWWGLPGLCGTVEPSLSICI